MVMGAVGEPSTFPAGADLRSAALAATDRKHTPKIRFRIWFLFSHYNPKRRYNGIGQAKMARGWESKSVEAQIESAQSRPPRVTGSGLSAAQVMLVREREIVMLSRTRVLHELETSKNPRYVKLLNRELKVLEEKLCKLQ